MIESFCAYERLNTGRFAVNDLKIYFMRRIFSPKVNSIDVATLQDLELDSLFFGFKQLFINNSTSLIIQDSDSILLTCLIKELLDREEGKKAADRHGFQKLLPKYKQINMSSANLNSKIEAVQVENDTKSLQKTEIKRRFIKMMLEYQMENKTYEVKLKYGAKRSYLVVLLTVSTSGITLRDKNTLKSLNKIEFESIFTCFYKDSLLVLEAFGDIEGNVLLDAESTSARAIAEDIISYSELQLLLTSNNPAARLVKVVGQNEPTIETEYRFAFSRDSPLCVNIEAEPKSNKLISEKQQHFQFDCQWEQHY